LVDPKSSGGISRSIREIIQSSFARQIPIEQWPIVSVTDLLVSSMKHRLFTSSILSMILTVNERTLAYRQQLHRLFDEYQKAIIFKQMHFGQPM
jgi:hypothetical protein